MRIEDLDYDLPSDLIAQSPVEPRDRSRMLVLDRRTKAISDRRFCELGEYLRPCDLLVLNDTEVIPARLALVRRTGTKLDALFVREQSLGRWELMVRGVGRLKSDEKLTIEGSPTTVRIIERISEKTCLVELDPPADSVEFLEQFGRMPLPPYIRRGSDDDELHRADRQRYQTVYSKTPGAIAAPTAGLHFTDKLLDQLQTDGIKAATVTLHVGRGTFEPISADKLQEHRMHSEWFSISDEAAELVSAARSAGGRIVAVGTTAVRVLESAQEQGRLTARQGWTDVFIYPPYKFKMVDVLITNFHLPRTTLLALVYAFAGVELTGDAYRHAIDQRYRFYSYGDAMVVV